MTNEPLSGTPSGKPSIGLRAANEEVMTTLLILGTFVAASRIVVVPRIAGSM